MQVTAWTGTQQTTWDVFRNVEEGDKIVWGDRKQGCSVTDVGERDGQKYIVAVGPAGGGPYVLTENYEGDAPAHTWRRGDENAERRFSRLEFTERWHQREDSEAGRHIGPEEYETLRRRLQRESIEAFETQDYRDLDVAISDVADQRVNSLDSSEVRGVLVHAGGHDPSEPAYLGPDRSTAADALVDDLYKHTPLRPDGPLDSGLGSEEYDALVALGARKVMAERDSTTLSPNELYHEAAREVTKPLSTADLVEIADMKSRMVFSEQNRLELETFVIGLFANDIYEEVQDRDKTSIRRRDGPIFQRADQYVSSLAGHKITFDDLRRSWGISPMEAKEKLKNATPLLADGGAPHTLVDEANQIYGEDVPGSFNSWRLDDPGIVTDGKARRMAWVNDETGDMLALVGYQDREDVPSEHFDRWSVFYYDAVSDTITPAFSSDSFKEAMRYARSWITGDEEAEFEVLDRGSEQYVRDNVDKEELSNRMFRASGYQLGGVDIPIPTPELPKRAGRQLYNTVGYVARATGRSAGRGVKAAGSYVWSNYKEPIASGVGWLLLFLAQRAFSSIFQKTRYGVHVDEEKIGVNTGYTYAPDDEEGTNVNFGFEASKDKDTIYEKLRLKERTTWVLGLGEKESERLWEEIKSVNVDWGVMGGNPGSMSDRERDEARGDGKFRQAEKPNVGKKKDKKNKKSGGKSTDGAGKTVSGSSSDNHGSHRTIGLDSEEEMEKAFDFLKQSRDERESDWDAEFGGKAKDRGLDDPAGAAEGDDDDDDDNGGSSSSTSSSVADKLGLDDTDKEALRLEEEKAGIITETDRKTLNALDGQDRDEMVSDMHEADVDWSEEEIDRAYEHMKDDNQSAFDAFPSDEEIERGSDYDFSQFRDWGNRDPADEDEL